MTTRYTRNQLFQNRAFKTVRRAGLAGNLALAGFNIFGITGSPVKIHNLFGVVTTAIGATAVACQLRYTMTGVGQIAQNLSAAHATMINDVVGTIYRWDGLAGGVLDDNAAVATQGGFQDLAPIWLGGDVLLLPGIISIANAVPGTGIIDWYIVYLPLLDTGMVTAL